MSGKGKMGLRTLIGGALALTLLSTSAFADSKGWGLGLPGVFGGNRTETAQPVPQPAPVVPKPRFERSGLVNLTSHLLFSRQ